MKNKQSWSIVLLCYNEQSTIAQVIADTLRVLQKIALEYEIIVIEDGSNDNSAQIIRSIAADIPQVRAIFHPCNMGIGSGLRSGYWHARYENVCAFSGDGQFDVSELIPVALIPENKFVSFYRRDNSTYSTFRHLLSWANRKFNQAFLGLQLRDVNWVKIYKLDKLRKLDLQLHSSLIESEICAKLLITGSSVREIASVYHQRQAGTSKGASWKIIFQATTETYKLVRAVKAFRQRFRTRLSHE